MKTYLVYLTSFTFQRRGKSSDLFLFYMYLFLLREVLGDIYLVCELMETDLSRVIRSRQQLLTEHI